MTNPLTGRSKKALAILAKRRGISGSDGMRKEQLLRALARSAKPQAKAKKRTTNRPKPGTKTKAPTATRRPTPKSKSRVRHPKQTAAARKSDDDSLAEQMVERSKYDIGVATKDLSKKLPRNLPASYGKDRIVTMVRDPFWLHCYWEV